jgi:chemotaxis protein MotB
MRCSTGLSSRSQRRLRPERVRTTRARLALLVALTAAGGCVTQGAHDRALAERDAELSRLERELTASKRSVDALENERSGLLSDMEELRARIDALELERMDLEGEVRSRERKIGDMRQTYDALVTDLESEVALGQLQISRIREGLTVQLPQELLFSAGSAQLSSKGREMVRSLAGRLSDGTGRVEVQGHSDDRPLSGQGCFATNWQLAGARAAAVTVVLQEAGVAAERLVAASYGEYAPVASNDTAPGRAQNRRIEVRVYEPARPLQEAAAEGAATPGGEPLAVPAAEPTPEGEQPEGGPEDDAGAPAGAR